MNQVYNGGSAICFKQQRFAITLLNLPDWWLAGGAVRNTVWRSPDSREKAEPAPLQPLSVCYPGIYEVSVCLLTDDITTQ